MNVQVVFVHGIRTSRTMWLSQEAHLEERGIRSVAIDLPGHGATLGDPFAIEKALAAVDRAVRTAAVDGPVLLVGHSMGGLLALSVAGSEEPPPVAGVVAASCTAFPRGAALRTYRLLASAMNALPGRGSWLTKRVLAATLPVETREHFGAGGYAYDAQDAALSSLVSLDLTASLTRIGVPLWYVNGQWDQLRVNEAQFLRLTPHAELIVVPRTTHLVTAMRPGIFNAVLDLAVASIVTRESEGAISRPEPDY
ncbi:alpha/beta hydrolase [Microbacterium sp.]|uniref:alpha/beta fold hydrolase n=1 Tax=Microbacterium sp. TaxID=51671 RepID=UPI0028111D59|nr:alpha/beta hydrolase [Microbacterium sp.]